jgi:predicted acetyltransferase
VVVVLQPSQQQFYAGYGYGNQQNPHYEQLRAFWQEQLREIEQVPSDPAEFKNHQLPLARIKKVGNSKQSNADTRVSVANNLHHGRRYVACARKRPK